MELFEIKQGTLCTLWLWNNSAKQKVKIDILMENIKNEHNINEKQLAQIKTKLKEAFLPALKPARNWNNTRRIQRVFKQKYTNFIRFLCKICSRFHLHQFMRVKKNSLNTSNVNQNKKCLGRPKSIFENSSNRTKRRRIQQLRNSYNAEQIAIANSRNKSIEFLPTKEVTNNNLLNITMYITMYIHGFAIIKSNV